MPLLKSASYNLASKEYLSIFIRSVSRAFSVSVSKKEEPLILSIETATRAGSVSLAHGSTLLQARAGDPARSHSADLLELISVVLREAGRSLREVELFAVALGPGSFTGLRIGIATVKSLASTLERRSVGVPTLEAIAFAAGRAERVVSLLPAGRGELFAQSFRVERGSVTALDEATHIPPEILLDRLSGHRSILFAGEGAYAQVEKIEARAKVEGITFIEEKRDDAIERDKAWVLAPRVENLAGYVGLLALERYRRGEATEPEELSALYVRPSDAELKDRCRT